MLLNWRECICNSAYHIQKQIKELHLRIESIFAVTIVSNVNINVANIFNYPLILMQSQYLQHLFFYLFAFLASYL